MSILIIVAGILGLNILMLLWATTRYKRCPSDRVLVIYGKIEGQETFRCLHGKAAFVWPVLQDYAYLDLTPSIIELDIQSISTKDGEELEGKAEFLVGISTEEGIMENAAKRLLALDRNGANLLAKQILATQLRNEVASATLDEFHQDRLAFNEAIAYSLNQELAAIGMTLYNSDLHNIRQR